MSFNNLDQLYRSVIMDHYKNPHNKSILGNGSMTIDMNDPICGDRIRLTFDIGDGIIQEAKFEGEDYSISVSSASMMTEAVRNHSLDETMQMSRESTETMLGEDCNVTGDMGDVEALQGISQFPARVKYATLAWGALGKGTVQEEGRTEGTTEEQNTSG